LGYHHDGAFSNGQAIRGVQEAWLAFFAFTESILLATFAAILAAHRSEILEKPGGGTSSSGPVLATTTTAAPDSVGDVETVGTYEGM
jgi:hypothetical protein